MQARRRTEISWSQLAEKRACPSGLTRTAEMWLACPAIVYAGARTLSASVSHA